MSAISLEELSHEVGIATAKPPGSGIQKIRYTHDAMIDLIIQNPAVSQNELGLAFGYSPSWVSTVIASDAFQARLAERREELVDPTIRATLEERIKALVLRSMEILQEKLSRPAHQVSDTLVLKSLELSTKAAGFGARIEQPAPAPQVTDHIAALAHRLIDLQANVRQGVIVNGQSQEVPAKAQVAQIESAGPSSNPERTDAADGRNPDSPA